MFNQEYSISRTELQPEDYVKGGMTFRALAKRFNILLIDRHRKLYVVNSVYRDDNDEFWFDVNVPTVNGSFRRPYRMDAIAQFHEMFIETKGQSLSVSTIHAGVAFRVGAAQFTPETSAKMPSGYLQFTFQSPLGINRTYKVRESSLDLGDGNHLSDIDRIYGSVITYFNAMVKAADLQSKYDLTLTLKPANT